MTGLSVSAAPALERRSTFNRYQFFPSSSKELLDEFVGFFHPYSYIYKYPDQSWQSAKDPRWKLPPAEISKAICGIHNKFIGTRWGNYTRHAVIDIDAKSQYHTASHVRQLFDVFAKAGLPNLVCYQSSDSGGWHIYIFFEKEVSSRKLQHYLKQLLRLSGYTIKNGTLEVFPDPGSGQVLGQGLRLPLQPGFAWIDQKSFVVRELRDDLSPAHGLGKFMLDVEENIHSLHDYANFCSYIDHLSQATTGATTFAHDNVRNIVPIRQTTDNQESTENEIAQVIELFGFLPPGIKSWRWLWGRSLSQTGLTDEGQRHEAIMALEHYYFYGDPSRGITQLGYAYQDERDAVVKNILSTKHNGLSKEIDRGSSDAFADISRASRWTPLHKRNDPSLVKYIHSASTHLRNKRANLKRSNQARAKIKKAVDDLLASGGPLRVNDLARQSGCSKSTLYKNQDIWRKSYQECLAASTGENSVGCGGIGTENAACTAPKTKKEPLELLAARQIVSEVLSRIQRKKEKSKKVRANSFGRMEQKWHMQLATNLSLLPSVLSDADIPTIKLVLNLLVLLKAASPSFEDQTDVEKKIRCLQEELENRKCVPQILTHGPPK